MVLLHLHMEGFIHQSWSLNLRMWETGRPSLRLSMSALRFHHASPFLMLHLSSIHQPSEKGIQVMFLFLPLIRSDLQTGAATPPFVRILRSDRFVPSERGRGRGSPGDLASELEDPELPLPGYVVVPWSWCP